MRRNLDEIERLDPRAEHQRILHLDLCYEFPFDLARAIELALFRTFAVPSIAGLLGSTGEFVQRTQRRHQDTDLILSTMIEDGYDSPAGSAALRRMNALHGRFQIADEDYLYVLSTFVFEPVRWIDRFGWRQLVDNERIAIFQYWRQVGDRMHIRDIPERYEDFERFNVAYEHERFAASDAGSALASATIELLLGRIRGLPLALGRRTLHAILDEPLLAALGLPSPTSRERSLVEGALRARGRFVALLPARRHAHRRTAKIRVA